MGAKVNQESDQRKLQGALDQLSEWANKWQMSFNESKCKVLHFGNRNNKYNYSLNNIQLEESDKEKDIGVIISNSLKPTNHIDSTVRKANAMLGQMSRAFTFMMKDVFILCLGTILFVTPILKFLSYMCQTLYIFFKLCTVLNN